MCYKEEVQKKNAEKLNQKFREDGVPLFIQNYLTNKRSMLGALSYWSVIKNMLLWLIDNQIINKNYISEITPEDMLCVESANINRYLNERERNGISPTTLNTHKNIFSGFWKSMVNSPNVPVSSNIIDDVSYQGISSSNNLIKKFPSEEQLKVMETKILKKKDDFVRARNLIILRVLKGTGLREAELAGLNMTDLCLETEMPYVKIVGKAKYREIESRNVYLTGDACNAIREWLGVREKVENIIDKNAVFLNRNGKRFDEENIKGMFKTYGMGITPHMMRHWYATIIASKFGVAFAQQQLGHTNVDTTINSYANGSYGIESVLKNM